MARLARLCLVGIPQNIIQRGNNRQVCFNGDEDFAAYANWLKEFADKYHVKIYEWGISNTPLAGCLFATTYCK